MAHISENNKGRLTLSFDSVREVFTTIEEQGWKPNKGKSSDGRGRDSFHFFDSLDEAKDVYLNHPERIRVFKNSDIKLESLESPGNDVYFDVTGDFVDVGRFLDGDPECIGNSTMGNPRSIFATINILIPRVHYTKHEYMNTIQRRVIRLVDWLENQQIRCQVVATDVSRCINTTIVVKQYTDPVDLNDLAVVCHSDFLRRICFLLSEQSKTWAYGYGNSIDYDERMKKYKPEPEDGLYIYVGGYLPNRDGIDGVNAEFDVIEERIKEMVDNGMTWNEEPLAIRGERG